MANDTLTRLGESANEAKESTEKLAKTVGSLGEALDRITHLGSTS